MVSDAEEPTVDLADQLAGNGQRLPRGRLGRTRCRGRVLKRSHLDGFDGVRRGADQTVGRPVGRSRAGLGAVSARFAVHNLATALSGLRVLHLNTEDFCHGLL